VSSVESEVRAIVCEVAELEPAQVTPTGTLADLGVDSLLQVEIAVEVERRYGFRFSEDELKRLSSFGSLVELTQAKLDAAGP
jgi:acyl carrier protein